MTRPLHTLRRFSLFGILLLCFSSSALAVSLSEYQRSLRGAITALDSLAEAESETSTSSEHRIIQTTDLVRRTLPETLTVAIDGSSYKVDNSWFYDGLREFEAASGAQQEALRTQLISRLRSIDERVTELNDAKSNNADSKSEANKRLAEILAREEYAKKNKKSLAIFKYIERFFNWLWQFLPQRSLRPGKVSRITVVAEVVVIALAVAVLIFVADRLIRVLSKRNRGVKVKKKTGEAKIVLGERLEPEASASDLLSDAETLARQGEIRAAIRKAYIALLVELGDRKIISLAQHKTNRDYLRSVRAHPSIYRNMSGLTDSFERHWYGFAQTSPNDWQEFRAGYLAALRAND